MTATGTRTLRRVPLAAYDAARLTPLIGADRVAALARTADAARETFRGRVVFNVNSTAHGGGVAEMLGSLLGYARGAGIDARWLVLEGDPAFFAVTKRIHNGLYGGPGDGGPLGDAERACYEQVARRGAEDLLPALWPGDVVVLHDPQPAGIAAAAKRAGATVVWRCHVGCEERNEWTERAWAFLAPYLADVDAFVVSQRALAPPWAPSERVHVIPPSIDPFATKNAPMSDETVRRALVHTGLIAGFDDDAHVRIVRADGTPRTIARRPDILQLGPPPPPDAPLVVQVSRWDRMKDMAGVMEGFAAHVDRSLGAHLLLVGPAVTGVADDPEAAEVLGACMRRWQQLPHAARARVHLACTPMADPDEQAGIVNAIQRHAAVVVQKSLAEGFGLTVAEAMWKQRPVVASAVGGIRDQIDDGVSGLLLDDPSDLPAFGATVERLLRDPALAARLGIEAHARVAERFLPDRHLEQYATLLLALAPPRRGETRCRT